MTGAFGRELERFLLPNSCVACGRSIEASRRDHLVCAVCLSRLRPVGRGCERCQQPLPMIGPCRFCAEWPAALGEVRSAVWLDDTARPIVHHLKYDGYHSLGSLVADRMAAILRRPSAGVLVPVPLAGKRQRDRGYNQAAMIARALGGRWGLAVDEAILVRPGDATSQTGLSPEERARNVAGAFTAAAGGGRGTRIILVDDVLTTGATLCGAADALALADWSDVHAVTFARAQPYDLRILKGRPPEP